MEVKILMFAVLAEQFGGSSLLVEVAEGATVADAIEIMTDGEESKKKWLSPDRVAVAVNQSYCGRDRVLVAGDEIALIPPVSGG